MNFSNHSKLRKLLSLLLVLALGTVLLTGCFGGKDEQDAPSAPETQPNININLDETEPSETEPQNTVTQPAEINENMATVLSQLTIRSSPSTDATVVGTLYAGDKVEVQRRELVVGTEWAYIISPDSGWICMDYVEMDFAPEEPAGSNETPAGATAPTEEETTDEPAGTAVNIKGVIITGLNIRKEPSTTADRVGNYNKGDVITILETKDGWGRTNKGWIKMDYVSTNAANNNTGTTDTPAATEPKDEPATNITSNGSTTVQFRGIVTASELNVRASASQSAEKVGEYEYGDRVEILEQDGNWGRTSKGWISLSYIYEDGTKGENQAEGVIIADNLNIRNGPGTGYPSVGSYNEGDEVTILEQFTYDGTTWGCTRTGWISMDYVDIDGTSDSDDNDDYDDTDEDTVTGYVTADGLRIRSGPGVDYATVGSLEYGDDVTITEQEEDENGVVWGKIKGGWISMDYVELD